MWDYMPLKKTLDHKFQNLKSRNQINTLKIQWCLIKTNIHEFYSKIKPKFPLCHFKYYLKSKIIKNKSCYKKI